MPASTTERRARFRDLHEQDGIFVMPNPWDEGSARLLEWCGFPALATTSAGFAWTLGRDDQSVARDELVEHVARIASTTDLPLNVDSERLFADDLAGVAETVRLLGEAGAAGCSIEDYDPATGGIDVLEAAAERVGAAAEAAHAGEPMVLTARAENHLYGAGDLADTIARLVAYRHAGADCLYAPGLTQPGDIAAVVAAVGAPVNVLALPSAPRVSELRALGVRRVSTGSLLASAAYAAMLAGARELRDAGSSEYGRTGLPRAARAAAFSPRP
jgi:2-methylisocitrate lyase-like PEP mutase family enzyme